VHTLFGGSRDFVAASRLRERIARFCGDVGDELVRSARAPGRDGLSEERNPIKTFCGRADAGFRLRSIRPLHTVLKKNIAACEEILLDRILRAAQNARPP
jgi:hypothetical protein